MKLGDIFYVWYGIKCVKPVHVIPTHLRLSFGMVQFPLCAKKTSHAPLASQEESQA